MIKLKCETVNEGLSSKIVLPKILGISLVLPLQIFKNPLLMRTASVVFWPLLLINSSNPHSWLNHFSPCPLHLEFYENLHTTFLWSLLTFSLFHFQIDRSTDTFSFEAVNENITCETHRHTCSSWPNVPTDHWINFSYQPIMALIVQISQ